MITTIRSVRVRKLKTFKIGSSGSLKTYKMRRKTKCGCLKRSQSPVCTLISTFSTKFWQICTRGRHIRLKVCLNSTYSTSCSASPPQSRKNKPYITHCSVLDQTQKPIWKSSCRALKNCRTQTSPISNCC